MRRACAWALMACALGAVACGNHSVPRSDYGIHPCPPSADDHLLSSDALQCWFTAPSGRWRTLSHESHYAMLVVSVEAVDVSDAETIAQRFVASERHTFSEILLYVQRELRTAGDIVRRIRWTHNGGFETLDLSVPIEK